MKYLLDTCVISEVIKKKPNENVLSWLQAQDESNLYLSILTFGEIEKGIEKSADQNRKLKLKLWVEDDLKQRFAGRVLPVDMDVVTQWGRIQGRAEAVGETMSTMDSLIAVSGVVNNCIVVTRNIDDMLESTAELLNPWESVEP